MKSGFEKPNQATTQTDNVQPIPDKTRHEISLLTFAFETSLLFYFAMFFLIKNLQKHYHPTNQLKEHSTNMIYIVLDIDETLMHRTHRHIPETHLLNYAINQSTLWGNRLYHCVLHPGCIEFLQFLNQANNLEFVFYSYGMEVFNKVTVNELMKLAFNDNKKAVRIFSREQTKNNCKDLMFVANDLTNTLIIDDSDSKILIDQKKNHFHTTGARFHQLHHCESRYNFMCANHLFYVTGVLAATLSSGRDNFVANINKLNADILKQQTSWDYYLLGLQELKKFNPQLKFHGNCELHGLGLEQNKPITTFQFFKNQKKEPPVTTGDKICLIPNFS